MRNVDSQREYPIDRVWCLWCQAESPSGWQAKVNGWQLLPLEPEHVDSNALACKSCAAIHAAFEGRLISMSCAFALRNGFAAENFYVDYGKPTHRAWCGEVNPGLLYDDEV